MDEIKVITDKITLDELKKIAKERFGDMVKVVVDIEQGIMAIGAPMHYEEESVLLDNGSKQENLWGINIYPDMDAQDRIVFDSLINIRPRQNNRTLSVEDLEIQKQITTIVNKLII